MLTRQQKQQIIEQLAEKLKQIKSAVFIDYKGLKVSQLRELRKKLRLVSGELKIAKKTLIDLALKKAQLKDISSKKMSGQIALAFSQKDEVSVAKILDKFSKENENLKILGAILEGNFLEENQAVALARIPSREQSLAKLVSAINAPVTNFVSILQANLRNLVFILSNIKK